MTGVALVSGAGRGLGATIARSLAANGAHVVVNDVDAEVAGQVVGEIVAIGGAATASAFDVTDPDACRAAVDAAHESLGRLDVVVANAGIASSGRNVGRTPIDEYERLHRVLVLGTVNVVQAALPAVRRSPSGSVVVVSSTAAVDQLPNSSPYSMAKAAVEAFATVLAKEEHRSGVTVNVVRPGMFDTRMGQEIQSRLRSAGIEVPLADPQLVADAVTMVLGARWLSGHAVRVG